MLLGTALDLTEVDPPAAIQIFRFSEQAVPNCQSRQTAGTWVIPALFIRKRSSDFHRVFLERAQSCDVVEQPSGFKIRDLATVL